MRETVLSSKCYAMLKAVKRLGYLWFTDKSTLPQFLPLLLIVAQEIPKLAGIDVVLYMD